MAIWLAQLGRHELQFFKLLDNAKLTAIGQAPASIPRIAIIGAGIAGMTAARELLNSGYDKIDIFEASDRVGGRDYSVQIQDNMNSVAELGAMRLPFFPTPQTPNSAMGYYANAFDLTTQPFPDPGVVTTGIYANDGFGPTATAPYPDPKTLIWTAGTAPPPDDTLATIYTRWQNFADLAKKKFRSCYVNYAMDYLKLDTKFQPTPPTATD